MGEERFQNIADSLTDEVYSRLALYDLIFRFYPAYTSSSCDWVIGSLTKRGVLRALGNGYYAKAKATWEFPVPSRRLKIVQKLVAEFPGSSFACIDSGIVNELSGMVGGEDWFLIETSKRDIFPVYMRCRELSKADVLLTPSEHELNYYLKPGSIIISPLFSKSPCRDNGLFTIEKLIVDLMEERLIGYLYPRVSFDEKLIEIIRQYNVNLITCINYARRRKATKRVVDLLRAALPKECEEVIAEDLLHD